MLSNATIGNCIVKTVDNRGWTPEEIADRAIDKIIYVGSNSHPTIRDQAEAFRNQIKTILVHYLKEAVQADRVTLAARLREAGHSEILNILN